MSNGQLTPPEGQVREIFLGALEKTDPREQAAFLEAACGRDEGLRQVVEGLLREQKEVGTFLETPALAGGRPAESGARMGPSGTALVATVIEQPGDFIGRYKLLQKIGEGGCGVVYMAEQEKPVRRRVALKIIKLGMDTQQVIARFEAERQALALMDHPNITKVLEAGATEAGRPFFVMELVRGIKITDYCDQNTMTTRDRLSLFIQVCQAVQHAHQKGIIHRDLKPSNILVTSHDGTPVPKVIDFGVAKATNQQRLTDRTVFTAFEQFIGTPAYMSPEQAEMSGLDIDTRTDIYSLGVLLYELLTGTTPFDAETLMRGGLDECRRTIREQEPAWPSTRLATLLDADLTATARFRRAEAPRLISSLRGDLDWIVMKALEKDRTRRYATANAVALDVQRYLEDEPVWARPPSNLYRLRKLLRRHRGAFGAAAGIAATLLVGAGISIWQAVRATRAEEQAHAAQQTEAKLRQTAERERERAKEQAALARLNEYIADVNLAQQALSAGNLGRAVQLLNKHRPAAGEPDLRGFEWRYLWQACQGDELFSFPKQESSVQAIAVSASGEWLAVGLREKVNLWDLRSRSLLASLPKGAGSLAFLPDGKFLITAGGFGPGPMGPRPSSVRIWRTSDWTEVKSLRDTSAPIALSGDGTRLVTSSREGLQIWDTATWKEAQLLSGASGPMAFSPDGKTLAADGRNGLTLWSLGDAQEPRVLEASTNLFPFRGPWFGADHTVAFSPDGKAVVAARNTLSERGVFILTIWDTVSGKEIGCMPEDKEHIEHTGGISGLVFSPDGVMLATASWDHSIRLWDFKTRRRILTLKGHLSEVSAAVFSPDGHNLVSGAKDGSVKCWATHRQRKEDDLAGAWESLTLSPDGKTLALLNRHGRRPGEGPVESPDAVVFVNLATREIEQQFPLESVRFRPPSSVALSQELRTMASALDDGQVKIWDTRTREVTSLKAGDGHVDLVALSPDGRALVTGGRFCSLRWWDVRSGTNNLMPVEAQKALFSPDGRWLATFERGSNTVHLWETTTRSLLAGPGRGQIIGNPAAFSKDGRILATTAGPEDYENAIHLWEVASGKLLGTCTGHKQSVWSVAFSPDGKTVASASDDSTLKLWNVATQQELLTIPRLGGALTGLIFSADGRLLIGAGSMFAANGGVRFYRAPLLAEIEPVGESTPRTR